MQTRKDASVSCTWERPSAVRDVRARAVVVAAFGPVGTSALRALCGAMPRGGCVTVISEARVAAPPGARDVSVPSSSLRERKNAMASPGGSDYDEPSRKSAATPPAAPADAEFPRQPDARLRGRTQTGAGGAGDGSGGASAGGGGGGSGNADACTFCWVEGHPASAAVLAAARAAEADTVMVAGIDDWDDEEADVQARSCTAQSRASAQARASALGGVRLRTWWSPAHTI